MSKTHFYRRAAPEAILAVDLTALLPPCSGGDIFSDPVPSKAAECARKSPSAKSDSGDRIGREGHQLAPTGRAECPHRSHLPVEGIRADAGPCQRSRLVDCLGRPSTRSLLHHGAVRSSVRSRELRPSVQSTRALLTWPSLLAFPLGGRPARPPKPPTSVWMNCTRGESSTRVSSMLVCPLCIY